MSDEVQRTLEMRARALAAPIAVDARDQGDEVVIFAIGRARLALASELVRSVRPLAALAPIPGAPAALAGVALIEGAPVLVWRLGVVVSAPDPPEAWTRLLFIGNESTELVVGVTAVEGFVRADFAALNAMGVERIDGRALIDDPRLRVD